MNSRIGLLFGVLLVLSLISTRFAPKAPLALSSGITPLWQIFTTGGLNLRFFFEALILERDLHTENTNLKNKVGELELRVNKLEQQVQKQTEVQQIIRTQTNSVLTDAQVIAFQFGALNAEIRINKGRRDGVQPKMAVTTPRGLVGDVMQVDETSALVRTILDPDFRVGIKVARYNSVAVARGVSGRFIRAEDYKNPKVKVGDLVFSSNSPGGVFPTVQLGVVTGVSASRGDTLGQTLEISPHVDISALEQVYVLRLP
ncbi:MAG: rod shape-determining protein MreC [Deinococcales bacterium]